MSPKAYQEKIEGSSLESFIYKKLHEELTDNEVVNEIKQNFPKPEIHRRNTGYAVDALLASEPFGGSGEGLNIAKLLCGSEGTLAFTTEITLQLDDLPPRHSAMVVTHYGSLEDCLADVAPVMEHPLQLCEMMDKVILDCTKNNRAQLANRFFVEGDPEALLMLELSAHSPEALKAEVALLRKTIESSGRSYASPVLFGDDIQKAITFVRRVWGSWAISWETRRPWPVLRIQR